MSNVINLGSTSSGPRGYSIQKLFLGCGALAQIREREAMAVGPAREPFPEDGKPVANLAGSFFGHLAQVYHSGTPAPIRNEFQWNGVSIEQSHKLTCAEVRRMYDYYVTHVHPEKWGRFVGMEVPCVIPESLFGNELTGAIDMVTEDDDGEWINDFKLIGREEQTLWEQYSLSHQGHLYALARELETGRKPKGVRYIALIKTKAPKMAVLEYEGLTDARLRWLQNFFETVAMKRANPRPEPHINHCISYGRTCAYLLEGKCSLV